MSWHDHDDTDLRHRVHLENGWLTVCCNGDQLLQLQRRELEPLPPTCLRCAQCTCGFE